MTLRHISFEATPGGMAAYAQHMINDVDQQLSLKINLLKSPRRFDTAPQSLTTLRGSCCSRSNPLTPLSPPGKTSHSWG